MAISKKEYGATDAKPVVLYGLTSASSENAIPVLVDATGAIKVSISPSLNSIYIRLDGTSTTSAVIPFEYGIGIRGVAPAIIDFNYPDYPGLVYIESPDKTLLNLQSNFDKSVSLINMYIGGAISSVLSADGVLNLIDSATTQDFLFKTPSGQIKFTDSSFNLTTLTMTGGNLDINANNVTFSNAMTGGYFATSQGINLLNANSGTNINWDASAAGHGVLLLKYVGGSFILYDYTNAVNLWEWAKSTGTATLKDGANLVIGTSSGTKIGTATTQKIGFYNATPVVQQVATTDLGTVLSNLGLRASGTAYPITTSGKVALSSGLTLTYIAKTANYTIATTDYTVDCTSGTFTITLPTAVGTSGTGQVYVIKNSGTGVITIATTSAQTIDGIASGVLTLVQGDSLTVQSNNANWIII